MEYNNLSENAPNYAKDFTGEELDVIAILQAKYVKRFRYGQQGHNYPFVEVDARDEILERLISKLPYPKSDVELRFLQGHSQMKLSRHMYNDVEPCETTTVFMKRENAKEFFSIFQNMKPRLDHLNVCLENNEKTFHNATDEEIEHIFYEASTFSEECKRSAELIEKFMLEKGVQNSAKLLTRRVSVLFGFHGNQIPFLMRLVYHKNANDFGIGNLKLCFTYMTYKNGHATHLLPFQKRINKLGIAPKESRPEKRKKLTPQEEQERKELEERENKIFEEHNAINNKIFEEEMSNLFF